MDSHAVEGAVRASGRNAIARPILEVSGLAKSYDGARARTVFSDVDLVLGSGEYIAIMGESGVGKSTLLNLVAGLDVPGHGRVVLNGIEMTALDDSSRTLMRRSSIGFVFQAFHLLPHITVAQNVALPLALNGVAMEQTERRVHEVLEVVGLASAAGRFPRELSGGEMQRVAIARAIASRPLLLLADEPTGNLDAETATQILGLLRAQVHDSQGAGILVTHSTAAAGTADRVLVLTSSGLQPLL